MAIKDSKDFDDLFNKYIDDCHFFVRIRDYSFAKATARDLELWKKSDLNS